MNTAVKFNQSAIATASDPSPIMALTTAYWGAQTLFTANRVGLFERLAQGSAGLQAIAADIGADERIAGLLLDACVKLGLVDRSGDKYGNSATSSAFLVRGKPGYLGDAIRYGDDLYAPWAGLERTLRSGAPAVAQETYLGGDPEKTRHFVLGMHDRALGIGQALVGMVDLKGRRRLIDVGGGPGTYSALFASANPGLRSTLIDLPDVIAIASEVLDSMGSAGSVDLLPGDYHETRLPKGADAVLISGVFHRETVETCRSLVAKAAECLLPGGLLLVSDVFTDRGPARPGSEFAALFGLNMALTAPDGGVHADEDVAEWMTDAGFTDVARHPFPPPLPHRLVTGRRR